MARGRLIRELQRAVGRKWVLSAPEDLLVYEYDATIERGLPEAVVLPDSAEQVAEVVRIARRHLLRAVRQHHRLRESALDRRVVLVDDEVFGGVQDPFSAYGALELPNELEVRHDIRV